MVYPNPFTSGITIDLGKDAALPSVLYVYNVTGQIVKEVKVTTTVDTYDFSNLNAGLYFIRYDGAKKSIKIVKN
jgi:hypothetical protein